MLRVFILLFFPRLEVVNIVLLHFQSEKRKQDLVADIVVEKQRGMDLPKIVRGSVPGPKSSAIAEKPSRARKVQLSISNCVLASGLEFVILSKKTNSL